MPQRSAQATFVQQHSAAICLLVATSQRFNNLKTGGFIKVMLGLLSYNRWWRVPRWKKGANPCRSVHIATAQSYARALVSARMSALATVARLGYIRICCILLKAFQISGKHLQPKYTTSRASCELYHAPT